jgi:hypothetical protein
MTAAKTFGSSAKMSSALLLPTAKNIQIEMIIQTQ